MSLYFANFYWYSTHYAKKLGIWGLLGLCLIIGSAVFYMSNISGLNASTEALMQARLDAESRNHKSVVKDETPPRKNSAEEIAAYYQRFPKAESLPEILATINQLANQQKLALNNGDYKLSKIKQSSALRKALTQYEITFPVTGQYTQIRTFVAKVLARQPAIALTDIQMHRENTMDPNIESKLVFTLFLKGETW